MDSEQFDITQLEDDFANLFLEHQVTGPIFPWMLKSIRINFGPIEVGDREPDSDLHASEESTFPLSSKEDVKREIQSFLSKSMKQVKSLKDLGWSIQDSFKLNSDTFQVKGEKFRKARLSLSWKCYKPLP